MANHKHLCMKCHRLYDCNRVIMRCKCGRENVCKFDRKSSECAEGKYLNICKTSGEYRSICDECFDKISHERCSVGLTAT